MKNFAFTKFFKFAIALPIAIVVAAVIVLIACGGFNLGIDFTGGAMMTFAMGQDFDLNVVRAQVEAQGITDAVYATSGSGEDAQAIVRMHDLDDPDRETEIRAAVEEGLQAVYPNATFLNIDRVGAVAGRELVQNAALSVCIACLLMLCYIWLRFEIHFGVTAVTALVIDVAVMLSMVAILRLQINSSFIAAVLTIVGYAINDTIVIFDRIRENRKKYRREKNAKEIADLSVRETLARTINTTVTTLLTIVTLYILGVDSIREFALPIIVGLIAGNFTSIFIAPSLWGIWTDKKANKPALAKRKPSKA